MEKNKEGRKETKSKDSLNYSSGLPSALDRYAMRQWFSLVWCSGSLERTYFYHIARDSHCALVLALSGRKVLFSMAIGNVEIMHECFLKHFRMGTARMK